MSDIPFCLICLRTDKILRTVAQDLFNLHDELCDFSLVMDKQAQYCLECEWKLRKFRKFKQMCIKADKMLLTFQQTGPSNKSLFQKPLFPPTLERSNGRNSKTFNYVYVETSENSTNTGYSVSKPMSNKKYDSNIRVKHISSPHSNDVLMKKIVRGLNPVSENAFTGTAIPRNKIIIFTKNEYTKSVNDELYEDSIGSLGDKHNAVNVDCLDDSNEGIVGTVSCNTYGEKDNVHILNDNLVTDTIDLLSDDEDDNDHVPLLGDNDVANAIDNADTVSNKNEVLIFTKPNKILSRIHPDQLRSNEIKTNVTTQNNKDNENIVLKQLSQHHGPKHVHQVIKMDDNSNETIDLRNTFLGGANVNANANSNVNNSGFTYINQNNKQIYCTTYKSLQKLTGNEIDRKFKIKILNKKYVNKILKLSKDRKEYFNNLSFVKMDKTKSKNVVMKDTKTSEISKNDTEEECSNDMDSQKSLIKKDNLAEVACVGLGQKLDENDTDVAHYSHDYNAELRIKTDSSENEQQEQKVNDETSKTPTELTNGDILSDDKEVKTMYVFDTEKYDLLKENNVHTNSIEVKEEIVEFAPDVVVKEEAIQYCEVILQNDDESEMVLETGNVMQSNETNVVVNEADETYVNETEESIDLADEMEQKQEDNHELSKFEGTLMQRKVQLKLKKMFKNQGEIKTADGDVISKEAILNFYGNMENEDKWKIARAIAWTGRKEWFPPEAAQILWMLQQKYEKEYASIFDIEYLNTEKKVRGKFLQRKTHSNYLQAKFKCELCIRPFENQKSLDYHNKWHDPSIGDYVCNLCQTRYKSKIRLYMHSLLHTVVYRCKLCPLITNRKPVMISHSMHHKGHRTVCQICGQSYRNGSSYNQHMMLHSRNHECNMCARNFASPVGLKAHKRLKHENVDVMKSSDCTLCDLCDVVYISHEVYLKHYKKVHDASAQTKKTVRALGAQWRKEYVEKPAKRRKIIYNFIEHPSSTESTLTCHTPQGRYASQTFAAATRAIQIARYNNSMREMKETDAKALMDEENSINEQDMTLVYEDDENVTNSINEEMVYVYEGGDT